MGTLKIGFSWYNDTTIALKLTENSPGTSLDAVHGTHTFERRSASRYTVVRASHESRMRPPEFTQDVLKSWIWTFVPHVGCGRAVRCRLAFREW